MTNASTARSRLAALLFLALSTALPISVSAGDLDSPAAPDATSSYTLEDIYNRLDAGTAGAQSTFTEPVAGPTVGTMHTINEIMGKAPASDNTNGAAASDVLSGKTFWGLRTGGWGPQTGSLTTQTPDNTTVSQPAGYYDAFNLSTVDTNLATGNIRSGVSVFGVAGDANVVNTSSGDAVAGDMLAGKKAWVDGGEVTGTATAGANVNGADGSKTFTIPDGLYSGSKTATATDADLAAGNIASGVSIFGVTGTAVVATGDAAAGDVLTGKTFSNAGGAGISGTMPNNGNGTTITPGTTDQTIAAGYWATQNTVSGDANLATGNIRSGVSIFGVPGKTEVVDTTEATSPVAAGRMKTDDVGFVNGSKITGTGTKTLSADSDTVNAGYYEGTALSAVDSDLAAANIRCGVTIFGVAGTHLPACVAKTGQTASYAAGDDGAYQKGCDPAIAPSEGVSFGNYKRTSFPCSAGFSDNGNGTVTDNLTGLIWLKNANCDGPKTWQNALTWCNSLASGSCGLTDGSVAGDWRLPNINELRSLFDPTLAAPYLSAGHPFTGVQWSFYWSSSTGAIGTDGAWGVGLGGGGVGRVDKAYTGYVWPVRGGQ